MQRIPPVSRSRNLEPSNILFLFLAEIPSIFNLLSVYCCALKGLITIPVPRALNNQKKWNKFSSEWNKIFSKNLVNVNRKQRHRTLYT